MPYVHSARLCREAIRVFSFSAKYEGNDTGYMVNRHAIEIPVGRSVMVEDRRKLLAKTKPGDRVVIEASVTSPVKGRVVHVECHPLLYKNGSPTYKRIYRHGETMFESLTWSCDIALDLEKLPWLYEIYINDEVVR